MNRRHAIKKIGLTAAAAVAAARGSQGGTIVGPPASGYAMPPEDAPHARTLMQWPVARNVYGGRLLAEVQEKIALIANSIARFEPVAMLAGSDAAAAARQHLKPEIEIWDIPTDDLWCRDSGPTFVKNAAGALAVAHIQFNGWGNKQAHVNDAKIAKQVVARLSLPIVETGLVGEQGGVEHDGAGTLLAHASCWVNPNRNRGSQKDIGEKLVRALGGKTIMWAPGIKGADITDYHIDALARFVAPGRVLIQLPDKPTRSDPWSVAAIETYEILKAARDAEGRKLDLVIVPEPVNIRAREADFVASYVNYYVCNGAVISGEFGDDKADAKANSLLKSLYPGREVVALNIDPIGRAGGGIHCATQQQPANG